MSLKDWLEVSGSLVGGAAIGAAVMYLFDPERGDVRREHLHEAAERALEAARATASATGESLGETWDDVSDRARGWGRQISKRAQRHAAYLRSQASDAGFAAGDWMGDANDQARGYGRSAMRSLRGYANRAGGYLPRFERHHTGSAVGVTAGVVGALALGAGLMYILDPNQGRRRREQVRENAVRYTNQAAQAVRNGAHQASDYARNIAQQAKQVVREKTDAEPQQQPQHQETHT